VIVGYVALAVIIVLAIVILNRLHAGNAAGGEHVRRTACSAVPAVWVGLEAINVGVMLAGRAGSGPAPAAARDPSGATGGDGA
jgi:hypothetical protein